MNFNNTLLLDISGRIFLNKMLSFELAEMQSWEAIMRVRNVGLTALFFLASASASYASVFDFNFNGTNVSGSGTFTGTLQSPGVYAITLASGSITDTDTASGAQATFTINGATTSPDFGSADNLLYFPAASNSNQGFTNASSYLDTGGITVTTIGGVLFNLYDYQNGYGLANSTDDPSGGLGSAPVNEAITSFRVSAVPEPSTWAMMILGFCGLGFMAYRRKQSALSVA
jgi:PEP-CTERM motif